MKPILHHVLLPGSGVSADKARARDNERSWDPLPPGRNLDRFPRLQNPVVPTSRVQLKRNILRTITGDLLLNTYKCEVNHLFCDGRCGIQCALVQPDMKLSAAFVFFALLTVAVGSARADSVTFDFSGSFDAVSPMIQFGIPRIDFGDHYKGSFTYDTAATASCNVTSFGCTYAVENFDLKVDGYNFVAENPTLKMSVDGSETNFGITGSIVEPSLPSPLFMGFNLRTHGDIYPPGTGYIPLDDSEYPVILPPESLNLADWVYADVAIKDVDQPALELEGPAGDLVNYDGRPTNLFRVPEPSTISLLCVGLLFLGVAAVYRRAVP